LDFTNFFDLLTGVWSPPDWQLIPIVIFVIVVIAVLVVFMGWAIVMILRHGLWEWWKTRSERQK